MAADVGLDMSMKQTSTCVVDDSGAVLREATVASDPDAIARRVEQHAAMVCRVGIESGPTSAWLWREPIVRQLPAICIDARHAKAALPMQLNKSGRNDAVRRSSARS